MPIDAPESEFDELARRWRVAFPADPGAKDLELQSQWLAAQRSLQQSRVDLVFRLTNELSPVGRSGSGKVLERVLEKWRALEITDSALRADFEAAERKARERRSRFINEVVRGMESLGLDSNTLASDIKEASGALRTAQVVGAGGNLDPLDKAWRGFLARAHATAILDLPLENPDRSLAWGEADANFQRKHVAPLLKDLRRARQQLGLLTKAARAVTQPATPLLQEAMRASEKRVGAVERVITETAAECNRLVLASETLNMLIANAADTSVIADGALSSIRANHAPAEQDDPLGELRTRLKTAEQAFRPILNEQIKETRRQITALRKVGDELLGTEPQRYQASAWRGFPAKVKRIQRRAAELELLSSSIGRRSPALVATADALAVYPSQAQVTGEALEALIALENGETDPESIMTADEIMTSDGLRTPHRTALLKRYRRIRAELQPQFEDAAVAVELARLREARTLLRSARRATRNPGANGFNRADARRRAIALAPRSPDAGGSVTRLRQSLEQTLTFLNEELDPGSGSSKRKRASR